MPTPSKETSKEAVFFINNEIQSFAPVIEQNKEVNYNIGSELRADY